jgi:hypothetical protein
MTTSKRRKLMTWFFRTKYIFILLSVATGLSVLLSLVVTFEQEVRGVAFGPWIWPVERKVVPGSVLRPQRDGQFVGFRVRVETVADAPSSWEGFLLSRSDSLYVQPHARRGNPVALPVVDIDKLEIKTIADSTSVVISLVDSVPGPYILDDEDIPLIAIEQGGVLVVQRLDSLTANDKVVNIYVHGVLDINGLDCGERAPEGDNLLRLLTFNGNLYELRWTQGMKQRGSLDGRQMGAAVTLVNEIGTQVHLRKGWQGIQAFSKGFLLTNAAEVALTRDLAATPVEVRQWSLIHSPSDLFNTWYEGGSVLPDSTGAPKYVVIPEAFGDSVSIPFILEGDSLVGASVRGFSFKTHRLPVRYPEGCTVWDENIAFIGRRGEFLYCEAREFLRWMKGEIAAPGWTVIQLGGSVNHASELGAGRDGLWFGETKRVRFMHSSMFMRTYALAKWCSTIGGRTTIEPGMLFLAAAFFGLILFIGAYAARQRAEARQEVVRVEEAAIANLGVRLHDAYAEFTGKHDASKFMQAIVKYVFWLHPPSMEKLGIQKAVRELLLLLGVEIQKLYFGSFSGEKTNILLFRLIQRLVAEDPERALASRISVDERDDVLHIVTYYDVQSFPRWSEQEVVVRAMVRLLDGDIDTRASSVHVTIPKWGRGR